MANDENLIPAKKGEVRNPNGRPKGSKNTTTLIREAIKAFASNDELKDLGIDPDSNFDPRLALYGKMAKNMYEPDKVSDSISACDKLCDRLEGKPTQKIEQKVEDNSSVSISFDEIATPDQIRKSEDTSTDND